MMVRQLFDEPTKLIQLGNSRHEGKTSNSSKKKIRKPSLGCLRESRWGAKKKMNKCSMVRALGSRGGTWHKVGTQQLVTWCFRIQSGDLFTPQRSLPAALAGIFGWADRLHAGWPLLTSPRMWTVWRCLPCLGTQRQLLFQERPSQLDRWVWCWGWGWKVSGPEGSFKGMFKFHALFLKRYFLQRHED